MGDDYVHSDGVAAIVLCALVMAALFGMTGVWLAFCAAEAITAGVMAVAMRKIEGNQE